MKRRGTHRNAGRARPTGAWMAAGILIASLIAGAIAAWTLQKPRQQSSGEVATSDLTFHKDIAPIIYRHCSPCHHPGEAAPFSLLNYSDVRKRARQIAEVTGRRIMPPWLPELGPFAFEG